MHVVLWDTRKRAVVKDDLGGWESWTSAAAGTWRPWSSLADRPVMLQWAYLAAVLRRLGHTVEHAVDKVPRAGQLFIFHPALLTLDLERKAIRQAVAVAPKAQILLTGPVAAAWPEAFADLPVKVVRGEPEQLLWKLDRVLDCKSRIVNLGAVEDLDTLPWPDWSPFAYEDFRLPREFGRRRVAQIHLSREDPLLAGEERAGRTLRCRAPERAVSELRQQVLACGCQALWFCDPRFGVDSASVFRLTELLAQLPRRLPFSIQVDAGSFALDLLRVLRSVGLMHVRTVLDTTEKPDPESEGKARELVAACQGLSIRTTCRLRLTHLQNVPLRSIQVSNLRRTLSSINATAAEVDIAPECLRSQLLPEVRQQVMHTNDGSPMNFAQAMAIVRDRQRRLSRLARAGLAGYQVRWKYWRKQAAVRWPLLKRLAIWQHTERPETDLAHRQTPKPLGKLEHMRSGASLRKDSPHKRSPMRRNHDRP